MAPKGIFALLPQARGLCGRRGRVSPALAEKVREVLPGSAHSVSAARWASGRRPMAPCIRLKRFISSPAELAPTELFGAPTSRAMEWWSWQSWGAGGRHRRRRPNRTAAERRAQARRAEARTIQHLLASFAQLKHRGCAPTRLGGALERALVGQPVPPSSDGEAVDERQTAVLADLVLEYFAARHRTAPAIAQLPAGNGVATAEAAEAVAVGQDQPAVREQGAPEQPAEDEPRAEGMATPEASDPAEVPPAAERASSPDSEELDDVTTAQRWQALLGKDLAGSMEMQTTEDGPPMPMDKTVVRQRGEAANAVEPTLAPAAGPMADTEGEGRTTDLTESAAQERGASIWT